MDPFQLQEQPPISDRSSPEEACFVSRFSAAPLETLCKKHPGKPSCYFISEEPWVQLCEKCALNMALCGRKIERRLTEDERRRRIELEGTVFELRAKSKIAEQNEADIKAKITIVESQYLVEVENLLRFYDAEIQEWTRKRNEVYRAYSEEILDYFKVLEQVRYSFSLSAMDMKNTLQTIQNNFVTMIHDLPLTDFHQQMGQCRRNLERVVENQEKIMNFDQKRQSFQKLVKQLIDKTQSFRCSKRLLNSASHNNSISTISQTTKLNVFDGSDSKRHEHSITPKKKTNLPILQQQNCFGREEQLKLRLKPTVGLMSSHSKCKLPQRKRINSKQTSAKKEETMMDTNNTSRLHRG